MISYKKKLPSLPTRQALFHNTSPTHTLDPHKKPWFQARKYLHLKDQDFRHFLEGKAPFNHFTQKLILKKHYRQTKCTSKELLVTSKKGLDFYKSLTSNIRKITYSNLRSSNLPIYRQKIKSLSWFKYVTALNIIEYPNAFTPKSLQYLPNLKTLSISLTSSKLRPISSKEEKVKLKLRKRLCLHHLNLKINSDCFTVKSSYPLWILQCLSTQNELKTLNLDAELPCSFSVFSNKSLLMTQNHLSMLLSKKNLVEFEIKLRSEIQNLLTDRDLSKMLQTVENVELWNNEKKDLPTRVFPSQKNRKSKRFLLLYPSNKLNIPNMLNQAISLRKFTWHQSLSSVFSLEQIPDYLYMRHLDLLIVDLKDFQLLLQLVSHIKSLESLSVNLKAITKPLFDSLVDLPALKHLNEFHLAHTPPSASFFRNSELSDLKIFGLLNELQNFSLELPGFSVSFTTSGNQQNTFSLRLSGRENLENFSKSLVNFESEVHQFTANLQSCPVENIHSLIKSINLSGCFKHIQEYFLKLEYEGSGCNEFVGENILANIPNSHQLRSLAVEIGNQKLIVFKTQENLKSLEMELLNINDLKGAYQFLSSRIEETFSISFFSIILENMDQEILEFLAEKFNNLSCFKALQHYSLELKDQVQMKIISDFLKTFKIPNLNQLEKLSIQFYHEFKLLIEQSKYITASLATQQLMIAFQVFLESLEPKVDEFSLVINEVDDDIGKALKELNTSACLQNVSKYSFGSRIIKNKQSWTVTPQKTVLVDPRFLVDFKIPFLGCIKALNIQCSQCITIKYQISESKKHCKVQFQSPLYLETFGSMVNDLGSIDGLKLTLTEPNETVGDVLGRFHQHLSLKYLSKYSLNFVSGTPIFSGDCPLSQIQIRVLEYLQDFHFHIIGKSNITLNDISEILRPLKSLRDLKVILSTYPPHPTEFSISGLAGIENLKVKLNFEKGGIENLCQEISTLKWLKRLNIESLNSMTFKPTVITSILRHSFNIMELMIKTFQQTFTLEDLCKQNEANRSIQQKYRNHKR